MSMPFSGKAVAKANALTILVVEDEDAIRMLVKCSLESRGYVVLAARNGLDAFQFAQDFPGIIDILITDLTMPGLGGQELAEKIHSLRPLMKILLMSGRTEVLVQLDQTAITVLAKPFSPSQLLKTVQGMANLAKAF